MGDNIFAWWTAGGFGIFLAGLGVFFWGLQFHRRDRRSKKEE